MRTGKNIKFRAGGCDLTALLIWFLCLLPLIVAAKEFPGLVVGVSDGDTIKILDDSQQQHTIRLMGIDAPEKTQAFGQKSKQSLSGMLYGQRVLVEWSKRDKYGRIVGKVITSEGIDVCLEQVARGMAWHYKKYAAEQSAADNIRYGDAEIVARTSKVGLWHDDMPMSPWIWRRSMVK
ncbi:MAG: thermonuclease family protein [Rhodoferax sp.]